MYFKSIYKSHKKFPKSIKDNIKKINKIKNIQKKFLVGKKFPKGLWNQFSP